MPSTLQAAACLSPVPLVTPLQPATRLGQRHESILPMNQILGVGDYIVSGNGLFFSILQSDGNVCG